MIVEDENIYDVIKKESDKEEELDALYYDIPEIGKYTIPRCLSDLLKFERYLTKNHKYYNSFEESVGFFDKGTVGESALVFTIILFSVPLMIIATPFYLINLGYNKLISVF